MKPIEESFQRLKQFTADASHELRSPLMAIKSNAAVALKYSEGMRKQDLEKFQRIASATHQMTQLTENLLLLARTNEQGINKYFQRIDLTSFLLNLVQFYQFFAQNKQIELITEIDQNLYVKGNIGLLNQLFRNLIENAIYYTPSQGMIHLQATLVYSNIIIQVKDTGVGIAPEHLEKVFERFWRADQSRSYKAEKSGLGLAIAQAIAQQHGGLIKVTSQLELGSCFIVYLPVYQSINQAH
jgi:signal transduction histidine kinase